VFRVIPVDSVDKNVPRSNAEQSLRALSCALIEVERKATTETKQRRSEILGLPVPARREGGGKKYEGYDFEV